MERPRSPGTPPRQGWWTTCGFPVFLVVLVVVLLILIAIGLLPLDR